MFPNSILGLVHLKIVRALNLLPRNIFIINDGFSMSESGLILSVFIHAHVESVLGLSARVDVPAMVFNTLSVLFKTVWAFVQNEVEGVFCAVGDVSAQS